MRHELTTVTEGYKHVLRWHTDERRLSETAPIIFRPAAMLSCFVYSAAAVSDTVLTHAETVAWCTNSQHHEVDAHDQVDQVLINVVAAMEKCGFVKVKGVVDAKVLNGMSESLHAFLRAAPETPLLATLRPSLHLDNGEDDGAKAAAWWPDTSWLGYPARRSAEPWLGHSGRAMLDVPFRPPFNSSELLHNPLLARLISVLLGDTSSTGEPTDPSLGVTVEQAAHIIAGPRTGRQQVHVDAPYLRNLLRDAATSTDGLAAGSTLPPLRTPEVAAAFRTLEPRLDAGAATYALNVQFPLSRAIEMHDGPTALCPASHSERFCRAYLPTLCPPRHKTRAPTSVASEAHEIDSYVEGSGLCSGTHRLHGTNDVGDALLYDSRLIHWGSANRSPRMRDVLSFSFTHEWYTETARDLTPEAVAEAAAWRRGWRARREAAGRTEAAGSLSVSALEGTHHRMRARRDQHERQAIMRLGVLVAVGCGVVGQMVFARWRRVARREQKPNS